MRVEFLPVTARHLVVAADLAGPDRYHVGDEAMAEANLAALRAADGGDLTITVTSADPTWTAAEHDCAAVPWAGFTTCDDDRQRQNLLRRLSNPRRGAGTPLVDAALSADAVIISGGGNLNSQWPAHLFERVLLGRIAARRQIPVLLTGQTIGPHLEESHRLLVRELLGSACLVGVREPHSAALAEALGVDATALFAQADDAIGLPPVPPPALPPGFDPGTPARPSRFIAVTMHPIAPPGDPMLHSLATQLAVVGDQMGAQLLYVPHVNRREGPFVRSDVDVTHEMAAISGGWVLEPPNVRSAQWAAQAAWLVVTTRYHPVVFATAAGVPVLALPSDHYTAVKTLGALGHVGLGHWHLNVADIGADRLADALGELARRHGEIASWLGDTKGYLQRLDRERRRRLLAGLGLPTPRPDPPTRHFDPTIRPDAPRPAGIWAKG